MLERADDNCVPASPPNPGFVPRTWRNALAGIVCVAISEYQVRQTTTGADVHVVGLPDTAAVTKSLLASLRRHGLANPEIRVVPVPRIERHTATGKLKRFIALSN